MRRLGVFDVVIAKMLFCAIRTSHKHGASGKWDANRACFGDSTPLHNAFVRALTLFSQDERAQITILIIIAKL